VSEHLLLLGHGSQLNPGSSRPVHAEAEALRRTERYLSVETAFWKEEPSFARALDRYEGGEVVVLPMFVSRGFFTEEVIPSEMGLAGRVTRLGTLTVRLAEPVGSHPRMADLVVARALESGAGASTAVAVLGHGTPRNPNSAGNVYAQAERVRATRRFAEVGVVFLEQAPTLNDLPGMFSASEVVVVPLFIADGWHVDESIPAELRSTRTGASPVMRYAAAAGTHPGMSALVAACVEEAMGW
jgi:sirohydrochlorin cobaltochelatase